MASFKAFSTNGVEHSQLQSVILQRTAELLGLSQRLPKVQDEERRKLSRDLQYEQAVHEECDVLKTLLMQPWKHVPWHKRLWNGDLAAVVAALMLACWIAYGDRHPFLLLGPSELESMATIEEQVPMPPAKTVPAESRPRFRTMPIALGDAGTASLLHGVELVTKIVHIGEDVTVRYFTPKPAPHRESGGQYRVVDMGEDVTVRYFAPVVRNTKN